MANFDKAFTKVIKAEGGYVNDPNDKGGETYLGISRRNHPNSKMWTTIDKVKKENPKATAKQLTTILKKDTELDTLAKGIYKSQYWKVIRGDEINSQRVAEQFFDMAVNAGNTRAIKLMNDLTGEYPPVTSKVTYGLLTAINNYGKKYNTRKI